MTAAIEISNMDNDPFKNFLDGPKEGDPFCPVDNFFAAYVDAVRNKTFPGPAHGF